MNIRVVLSLLCLISISASFSRVAAGPVGFDQVIQVLDARPGKADSSMFARIAVASSPGVMAIDDDDDKKKKPQDSRVITETRTEIVEDDQCDCVEEDVISRGFPKWALLGLAAIPLAFIIIKTNDTPTPTPTSTPPGMTPTPTPPGMTPTPTPPGMTPTPTPTPPGMTPTPTPPGMTPTPTPPGMTPTPTPTTPTPTPTPKITPTPPITPTPTPPEPVPEPITILLFGTGLASIGLAARRRFGKKDAETDDSDEV